MSITDSVANALTMMRNAVRAKKEYVDMPASNLLKNILEIFKTSGYVDNFKVMQDNKQGTIRAYFKFVRNHDAAITDIKKISRPGLRLYVKKDKIPFVLRGKGTAVISTSKGILTGRQARDLKIGGEVICYIW